LVKVFSRRLKSLGKKLGQKAWAKSLGKKLGQKAWAKSLLSMKTYQ